MITRCRPPLLLAIRYVKKAKAELAQGDIKEVTEEMEEIAALKGRILVVLREKRAEGSENFFEKVEAVVRSAEGGNREEAAKILSELEAYLAP